MHRSHRHDGIWLHLQWPLHELDLYKLVVDWVHSKRYYRFGHHSNWLLGAHTHDRVMANPCIAPNDADIPYRALLRCPTWCGLLRTVFLYEVGTGLGTNRLMADECHWIWGYSILKRSGITHINRMGIIITLSIPLSVAQEGCMSLRICILR